MSDMIGERSLTFNVCTDLLVYWSWGIFICETLNYC